MVPPTPQSVSTDDTNRSRHGAQLASPPRSVPAKPRIAVGQPPALQVQSTHVCSGAVDQKADNQHWRENSLVSAHRRHRLREVPHVKSAMVHHVQSVTPVAFSRTLPHAVPVSTQAQHVCVCVCVRRKQRAPTKLNTMALNFPRKQFWGSGVFILANNSKQQFANNIGR